MSTTTKLTHNASGASRVIVKHNGRQKSVPMDYSAYDFHRAALLEVLGDNVLAEPVWSKSTASRRTWDVSA
jgi:hypothetical protein